MRLFTGQRAWLLQRVSAVLLLLCLVGAAVFLVVQGLDFAQWRVFVAHPVGMAVVFFAALSICLHGWVGGRDIVLDYVHQPLARLLVLTLIASTLGWSFVRILFVLAGLTAVQA